MDLKKRNLYSEFFSSVDKRRSYASEEAYLTDVFAGLKVRILAWRLLHLGDDEKGYEPFTEEQAKRTLENVDLHIETRLIGSGTVSESFRTMQLCAKLGMTEFELFVFHMAYASVCDPQFAALYSTLVGEKSQGLPTLQLALELFRMDAEPGKDEISAAIERRTFLFRYILDTEDKPVQATSFTFRISERVCAYLTGGNAYDRNIRDLVTPDWQTETPLPIRQDIKSGIRKTLDKMLSEGSERGYVLQLYGPEGIGKRRMLDEIAREGGFSLLYIDLKKLLLATNEEMRRFMIILGRECILQEAIPCFFGYEPTLFAEENELRREIPPGLVFIFEEMRTNYQGVIWLSHEKADYLLSERLHVRFFELPMLTVTEREVLWKEETKSVSLADEVNITACANQYILTPRSLHEVVQDAAERAGCEGRDVGKEDIREAVADQVQNQLGTMATHIRSIFTWEDLVIDDRGRRQLENICNQVRFRSIVGEEWGFYKKTSYGRGICAMFYGQPGTGKTMAAQVIANELGMELYRIDISQMVSKYIGETQKNITKLFERAKHTNAILFFDEADALFSKRSEVKDFHDKHANAETAHLLQKLEDYEGITILATNFANNIDDAFKRRIKFMVNFVFPEADVRRQLWQTILPKGVPNDEELDLDFFADEFELSGSGIKEILTNAAFLAAARGRGLTNHDLAEAVKDHFEKHGKVLSIEEFKGRF